LSKKIRLSKLEKEIMEAGAKAGDAGIFVDSEIIIPLVETEMFEINPEIKNESGDIAARLTTKGKIFMSVEEAVVVEVPKYEIEDGFVKTKNARKANAKYPFDSLEVGQSFFVAGKEVVKMGGTVASANKRNAEVVEGETRTNKKGVEVPVTKQLKKFAVNAAEKNGVKGVQIGRIL
jgi:hypothetical protein